LALVQRFSAFLSWAGRGPAPRTIGTQFGNVETPALDQVEPLSGEASIQSKWS
jgi:hypothetical protein